MTAFSSEAELRKFLRQLRALTLGPMPWGEEEESLEEDQSCLFPPEFLRARGDVPAAAEGRELLACGPPGPGESGD